MLRLGTASVAGRRPTNQDAVAHEELPDGGSLVALADGMGGHRGGAVASRIALEVLAASVRAGSSLGEAIEAAHRRVLSEGEADAELHEMGTTVVAAVVRGGEIEVGHVGDSRAYRVDDMGIHRLTADHSLVEAMIRDGRMSPQAAEQSPMRHVLSQAVGSPDGMEPELATPFATASTELLILTSDGLHGSVPEADILSTVRAHRSDLQEAADALVALAGERGSTDNISVVIAAPG